MILVIPVQYIFWWNLKPGTPITPERASLMLEHAQLVLSMGLLFLGFALAGLVAFLCVVIHCFRWLCEKPDSASCETSNNTNPPETEQTECK
jgi:hypothetical protein